MSRERSPKEIEQLLQPFINDRQLPPKISADELRAFLEHMKSTEWDADPEINHSYADVALLAFIGNPDVATSFFALERWYA